MQIQLISGRFSIAEAEQLLTSIIKVKLAFHEEKIRTVYQTEEDIKHSETRIKHLEDTLRKAIIKLKEGNREYINVQADIELRFPPQIGQ